MKTLREIQTLPLSEAKRKSAAMRLANFIDSGRLRDAAARKAGQELLAKGRAKADAEIAALKKEEVELTEEELHEARIKIVRARIRGGKVQRRKKVSNVKGYTIRGGKLTRMSPKEKLDRKRGARKGKIKRKAKLARALIKRKRSLRKRASLGLK